MCTQYYYSLSYFSNSYQLRVEGMILKEEFKSSVEELKPSIDCLQHACKGKRSPHAVKPNFVNSFNIEFFQDDLFYYI